MRLGLFDRIRRLVHPRRSAAASGKGLYGRHRRGQPSASARDAPPGPVARPVSAGSQGTFTGTGAPAPRGQAAPGAAFVPDVPPASPPGPPRVPGPPAVRVGPAQARVREAPEEAAARSLGEAAASVPAARGPRANWYDAQAVPELDHAAEAARAAAVARAAAGVPQQAGEGDLPYSRAARTALRLGLPFAAPHPRERPHTADGRRNCGSLEAILWRQWDTAVPPPAQVVEAIDRLAELPGQIKEQLAAGLDAIFVGPGGVPELDEMTALRGVRLPSGQASWDACAGAYGEGKIVVGSQPSPTPDVMCHEVGHALDDLDSPPGKWQSDSAEFRMLYDQCQPHLASDFHRQPGGLGRKEFFADAFAAIASGQRPALVDMLSGDTRAALRVMLFFNRRYGI
jgi:hypothetical protein